MLQDASTNHSLFEDVQALCLGILMLTLGLIVYASAGVFTGGLAGLALILDFTSLAQFGVAFWLLNLPFYLLALARLGWRFTLRMAIAVTLVSAVAYFAAAWITISEIHPAFGSVSGGVLCGTGIILLLRHNFSVGGINVLAHFLQERRLVRAGVSQLVFDVALFVGACFVLPMEQVGWSLLGAMIMNLTIAVNHRPGRYMGVS